MKRALGAAALGIVAWSTLIEPRLFTLRRHTLPVLPERAAPLRILQLSDLHLAPWQHRKIDWVRRLAALRPDLVVLTGDQLGHRGARGPLLHALQPLAGVPGVFVHGSNDSYGPIAKNPLRYLSEAGMPRSRRTPDLDTAALTRGFEGLGFINLNNSAARLTIGGSGVELFGLDDPHIRRDNEALMNEAAESLPRWRRKAPPTRIGVVHAPYQHALNALLDRRADVILAGHTHGGQVRVPGIGALTANCDLPVRQARGMSVWYDAHHAAFLNVSAGLGASIYSPIRFACRPEASLITLESARG